MSATHSQVPAIEGQSQIDTQEQSWPEDRDEVEGGDAEEPLAFEAEEEGDASQGHEEGLLNEDGDEDAGEDVLANEADVAEVSKATKKKRERKAPVPLGREQGKSFYPMSRVQKIIKADKDLPIIAKEATFLISIAAEEFLKRFAQAAQRVAEREKRLTVQPRDIAHVAHNADEYTFLGDIVGYGALADTSKPKRQPKGAEKTGGRPTMLDRFVVKAGGIPEEDEPAKLDGVIMNQDGTMAMSSNDDDAL